MILSFKLRVSCSPLPHFNFWSCTIQLHWYKVHNKKSKSNNIGLLRLTLSKKPLNVANIVGRWNVYIKRTKLLGFVRLCVKDNLTRLNYGYQRASAIGICVSPLPRTWRTRIFVVSSLDCNCAYEIFYMILIDPISFSFF